MGGIESGFVNIRQTDLILILFIQPGISTFGLPTGLRPDTHTSIKLNRSLVPGNPSARSKDSFMVRNVQPGRIINVCPPMAGILHPSLNTVYPGLRPISWRRYIHYTMQTGAGLGKSDKPLTL